MRHILMIAAVAALSACQQKAAEPANDANVAAAEAPAATPVAMSLNETTWTFTDKDGKKIEVSVDAAGNYIDTSGTEHVDHGTYVTKDGKGCFTSAMTKEGEVCWTLAETPVGGSFESVSDKGEKIMVTRVAYVAKTM